MALAANAFTSYATIGLREDLSDLIFNVDQAEVNFLSSLGRTKATQKVHEWQTDTIPAMDTANQKLEGDVWAMAATTATTRLNNVVQISYRTFGVTASQEAMDKAGRAREIAHQTIRNAKALKRDMEGQLFANGAKVSGDSTTARKMAGLLSWVGTNDVFGSGGASPATLDGAAVRTDGTQRPFLESYLQDVLQLIWQSQGGGIEDKRCYLGGFNKRVASGFTGNATKFKDADDKRTIATASIYESDFGMVQLIPNVNQRARDVWVLDSEYWAISDLRPVRQWEIMEGQFDGEARVVLWEGTFEARNEKASGGIFDNTTS